MAQLRFYADATALISLARIGRLDLLTLLPTPVYATARVWAEATGNPTKPGVAAIQQARTEGLVAVVDEDDPGAFPELDPGESTVLSAAAAVRAARLIDERRARTLANTDSALRGAIRQATGTVGLILLAKRRGRIPAVRPLLDALIGQRFRISPALYRDVLRQAGEL
ncbi:MAG: DUF3368 domain-containing protein [Chloroflexi bacterium]|nr:DUF3368 domain-containing protein [Chloroflexota bacterium]